MMWGRVPGRVDRAVGALLDLDGPIEKPIKVITRYQRRWSLRVEVNPGHLLTVLGALEAGTLTPAEVRTWATVVESVYLQRVYQIADWPQSEDTDQTRTRLVLRNLSGTEPCWLGLNPYGLDAMQRYLAFRPRDWEGSVRVLCETLTDPANPLTYAYTHDGTDLAVYPTGKDHGFILAMHPPEDAESWEMPQKLAIGTVTENDDLKVHGLYEVEGGGTCTPDMIRGALALHRQAIVDHLTA